MYKLIICDRVAEPYEYYTEKEFERAVVENNNKIFGQEIIYFDIKKKLGAISKGASIPDGYLLDLKFHTRPALYFVEIELESHDVYGHIGEQLLRFSISFDEGKYKLKNMLLDEIKKNKDKHDKICKYLTLTKFANETELIDKVVYDMPLSTIIVIDKATDQLSKVLSKLSDKTDIIEFETYKIGNQIIHRYTPFQEDVIESENDEIVDADELDTIVVPAKEDGFNEVFLGKNCWYSIRISSAMLDKIKYIAAYQVAPVSAITYYAEVEKIERYQDTDKYLLKFKDRAKKISPIELGNNHKGIVLRSPRYTNFNKMIKAHSINQIFGETINKI